MKMNIKNMVIINEKSITRDTIKFDPKVREWCKLPYPDHKKGCPNYGRADLCPPKYPYVPEQLDSYQEFILVWATFDFKQYKDGMKKLHPTWTDRQLSNPLYWQGALKKLMRNYINEMTDVHDEKVFIYGAGSGFWKFPSMEAAGIDVFHCLRKNGVQFDVKPKDVIVMVALVCVQGTE